MPGQSINPTLGPWIGLDESGRGGPTKVVAALNVVFEDGVVRRRPGRARIAGGAGGPAIRGIFEHTTLSGTRRVVVVSDALAVGEPPRVSLLDAIQADGTLVPIGMSADLLTEGDAGRLASATAWRDRLLIAGALTGGRILDFDGGALQALSAARGLDAVNGIPGADAYLERPPTASILATWRSRVLAIAGPDELRRVAMSIEDNDVTKIPAGALSGGANVWPADRVFSVQTEQGDEIVAGTVLNDRLVLLTRRGVLTVDEDATAPIARNGEEIGCIARGSVQRVGNRIVYLADGKVCVWESGVSREVSDPIKRTLSTLVNWTAAGGAVSAHLRSRSEYRLWLPILGEARNQLCVVWDYARDLWRIYCGHFPFGTAAQRAGGYDVTAAATVISTANEEVLLTGDSAGGLWREDVGDRDAQDFPAFVVTPQLGEGQAIFDFRDWYVEALWDGQLVTMGALRDGESYELAAQAALAAPATTEVQTKALVQTAQLEADLPFAGGPARWMRSHFQFQGKGARLRGLVLWPTGAGFTGARGGIRTIEVGMEQKEGRR